MRLRTLAFPAAALAACLLLPRAARADGVEIPRELRPDGEIQLRWAAGGEGSSWLHDGAPITSVQLGFRFKDIVAPYLLFRIGYGNTNQRVLEMIQLGVQVWARLGIVRPYARFGVLHQHEEPWASVEADGIGSLLGVGDGIRHRQGIEGALGIDIPFVRRRSWQFHATVEGLFTWIPTDNGPPIYAGGTLGLGFDYGL